MNEDAELLRRYVAEGSEEAFSELIRRHVDLVYSSALRLLNDDTHRAQDVTQQVFVELARQSQRLSAHPALIGWLYTTVRRMALRAIRTDSRRKAREHEAHIMNENPRETAGDDDWENLAPVLEDAMHDLGEKDRLAILLRFFKDQSLKQVGAALGLTENAARMRVERALEKLRRQLTRKGATTTTAALALMIPTKAATAAPTAFVSALSSACLSSAGAATGGTLTFLQVMAMTKSQLGLVSAVIIASVVAPLVVQHHAEARLREHDIALREQERQRSSLEAENQRLSNLIAQANASTSVIDSELLRARGEVGRLRRELQNALSSNRVATPSRSEVLASITERYAGRIEQLKQFLAANPAENIPEMQFMTDKDWLWLAGEKTPDTPEGYQRAMSLARLTVEGTVAREVLRPGLKQYAADHDGKFPTDLAELKSYCKAPLEDGILQRWEILHGSAIPNLGANLRKETWVITQKAPINHALDQRIVLSVNDFTMFADAPPNQWDVSR